MQSSVNLNKSDSFNALGHTINKVNIDRPNSNNPLGLLMVNQEIYSLLGFYHYRDYAEINLKKIKEFDHDGRIFDYQFEKHSLEERFFKYDDKQEFLNLGLNLDDHKIFQLDYGFVLVFKRSKDAFSIKELKNVTKSFKQAALDYIECNETIKLIASPNRVLNDLSRTIKNEVTLKKYFIDKDLFNRLFLKEKNIDQSKNKILKENIPFDSYSSIQKKFSNSIIDSSERKGEFIEVTYNNKKYNVPLLILKAWHEDIKSHSYDFAYWTFFFVDGFSLLEHLVLGSLFDKEFLEVFPKDLLELLEKTASSIDEESYLED